MQCYQCTSCRLKYAMLSLYLVKVKICNDITVPGGGYNIQCYQFTWCRLKYTMLSVYMVQVKVYNVISVPRAA